MSDKEGAAPPPEGVVPDFQHPQDVLHTINLVSQILSIVSVSIFMMLRIYAKTLIAPPFYLDDWMAVIAWILSVGYSSTALVMHRYGGGFHIYEISKDNFVGFLKGLYADTLVYGPNSYFTKLALLLIVIRVFRLNKKTIIGTYAVIVFMTGYYVPVLFLKMFICHPIAGYWDSTLDATCFNQRAIFVADTAVSAITDTAVLCLPIPVALSLRMSWTKRLKVILMLSAGGVATAASIVRMILVIQLQKSDDEPVDFIRFNLLGTAEVSIGMICACLPAINILFMRGFSGSQQSSCNTGQSSKKYFELKFLMGSKLQTQNLTAVNTTGVTGPVLVSTVNTEGMVHEHRDSIFPIERMSRVTSIRPDDVERGIWSDEWYSKVTASPFSEPGSPDWARRGSVGFLETITELG
ncbi:hypothetical protein CMEL01_12690 [Colletotrichum melonis]|uniref:Rhodopsin domain-containing protein n=1 Tax=Colletotrichum melonis TaxID=1209925 RepID=A0AAI9USI7_9PEZI|nr:hypothetical protein CMEL01_12690 [Colletotrichum melonis]